MRELPSETEKLTEEERETINSLLKYPSLERIFDEQTPPSLPELRTKMMATIAELERTIRSGSKADADQAGEIAAAYRITLKFLEELEDRRKRQPPKL